ncbi:MAG: DEAD/DEAH box helicase [Mesorhizobium sp.]|nr:MAG: DEAD/DEAH box helicase [Mesorhizobium sp.]RWK13569.1 MAG: DEAD/DEAH box helicase [Mesorhizobium sp.]
MRPEAQAQNILSTVRSTAKMHEFRVAPEDFIQMPRDPRLLFPLAVGILGDAAAAIAEYFLADGSTASEEERPQTWDEDDGSPRQLVHFAATFFDAYLEAQLDDTLSIEFSLLCATAYYLSDSVGSAAVVIRHMQAPDLKLGQGLAHVAYKILLNDFAPIEGEFSHREFADTLLVELDAYFRLQGTGSGVAALCRQLREHIYADGSTSELLYSDIVTALCARKFRNSARRLLPPFSGLPLEAWSSALVKPHFPKELWPAQQRIGTANLLMGRSAVIQMPTSAGKTRATELIIRAAFLSARASLAVIVAPFRSLCHDIRGDLARAFAGENISLDEVSDSYQLDVDLNLILSGNTVLIVTPEKLLYMLRQAPALAERVGLIIYDEGHQFEGLTRGPTYELLLSSLRMTMAAETQVILISAVIGNAAQIADWLIRDASAVVTGQGLLAMTKSIAFASWQFERGQLQYVQPNDPDEREFYVPRIIDTLALAKLPRERRDRVFPDREHPSENSEPAEVGLYLGLHLVPNGSVAVFCGQKSSVTKMCRRAVEIFNRSVPLAKPLQVSNTDQVQKIANLARRHLGDVPASQAAALGIFGHHANTPQGLRLSIEHAMKTGDARFVICTSTLAQGVNFPIRYLIVTATQQGREQISVRDFQNLIGRAGRAGMYTEGSVIFSAPVLFDERRSNRYRWLAATKLLNAANSEPSRSSILDLFDSYRQIVPPIVLNFQPAWLNLAFADRNDLETIISQVLQAYPVVSANELRPFVRERARAVQSIAAYLASHVDFENPSFLERVAELAENTLAYHLADEETREKLKAVFRLTAESLQANADANFRLLIRRSPLPAADIGDLTAWLNANLQMLKDASVQGTLLAVIFGHVRSLLLAKSITGISDQTLVLPALLAWMGGWTFHAIWEVMSDQDVRVSGDRITVEHVVALCEGGFAYELAMIFSALADLTSAIDEELHTAIAALQKRVKYGLTNLAEFAFAEAGFADRIVASALATAFPAVTSRAGVRQVCRMQGDAIGVVLTDFPAYFATVADELRTG